MKGFYSKFGGALSNHCDTNGQDEETKVRKKMFTAVFKFLSTKLPLPNGKKYKIDSPESELLARDQHKNSSDEEA